MLLHYIFWVVTASRVIQAQHAGDWMKEVHPPLKTWTCTADGCTAHNTSVVLEASHRHFHLDGSPQSCLTNSGTLVTDYCYDEENCAHNCRLEGGNYTDRGISTVDNDTGVKLELFVKGIEKHPRAYLFDEDTGNYSTMNLVGQEFTFDVDMSKAACDLAATLYLVQMPLDGGKNIYNSVGAAYGTGYCDYACPHRAFINGTANVNDYGSCCVEIDLWEANTGITHMGCRSSDPGGPHICRTTAECTKHKMGDCGRHNTALDFYGWGSPVDVRNVMTVVTQFHSTYSQTKVKGRVPGSAGDKLVSWQRLYVQKGKIISRNTRTVLKFDDSSCPTVPGAFGRIGNAMKGGVSVAFSMFYSKYWGGNGGGTQCWHFNVSTASVVFSNLRWGDI